MQPYHQKDFRSFRVPKGVYNPQHGLYQSMQLHSMAFCQILARQLGWNIGQSYRVPGKIVRSNQFVCFELKKAEPIYEQRHNQLLLRQL